MKEKTAVRRAQLISPFGVGSLVVSPDGTSYLICSLDEWFLDRDEIRRIANTEAFEEEEPRLAKLLGVGHFRLPPDWRPRKRRGAPWLDSGEDEESLRGLCIPAVRFPRTYYCPSCGQMELNVSLYKDEDIFCHRAECAKRKQRMVQMRFIGVCSKGHLMDIPWREWLRCDAADCATKPMTFQETGGGTLGDARVLCGCRKVYRSLSQLVVTESEAGEDDKEKALGLSCLGLEPWKTDKTPICKCDQSLKLTLRNANNVYYAKVVSALYLREENVPKILRAINDSEETKALIDLVWTINSSVVVERLRGPNMKLGGFSAEDVERAIKVFRGELPPPHSGDDYSEDIMRREEFDVLSKSNDDKNITIRRRGIDDYEPSSLPKWFSSVSLVHRVRETRVLAGFNRHKIETADKDGNEKTERARYSELRKSLWRREPGPNRSWLPCTLVYGEGIFLDFDLKRLSAWEERDDVKDRVKQVVSAHNKLVAEGRSRERPISARFVMIHTFAHLLMNQLTFSCGYSSASLRERLYVSREGDGPMNGVFIYTAAGDSDGTLGGLVAMGERDLLPEIIETALDDAEWCSSDPVCRESPGQGPDSCNLAACHSCALVPETSCEEFNRFVDRMLVIGSDIGFFRQ